MPRERRWNVSLTETVAYSMIRARGVVPAIRKAVALAAADERFPLELGAGISTVAKVWRVDEEGDPVDGKRTVPIVIRGCLSLVAEVP